MHYYNLTRHPNHNKVDPKIREESLSFIKSGNMKSGTRAPVFSQTLAHMGAARMIFNKGRT